MLFLWKKSYELKIPEIDVQHRRLVGMINELSDAMMQQQGYRVVSHIIGEMVEYVELHFSTEETLMSEHGYPGFDDHHRVHLDLTNKVKEFKTQYESGEQDVSPQEILDFLCDWLRNHIMVDDKKFGEFLHKRKWTVET